MALEIFKTPDDLILFGQDGNIFRTPYNLDKGITSLSSVRIRISNLGNIYTNNFAASLLYSKANIANYDGILMFSLTGATPTASNYSLTLGNLNGAYTWRPEQFGMPTDTNKFKFICVTKNGSTYYSYANSQVISGMPYFRNVGGNCDVYLGYSYESGEFRTLSSGGAISEFAFFNRYLTQDEILYRRSNMSINDFMSLSGCTCYLLLNYAELLDFSALQNGSDMRIGCRDYSGFNNHGEIINLPAGTVAEKINYTNTYLFKHHIA